VSADSWERILEISREIAREHASTGDVKRDAAVKLARAILLFQNRVETQAQRPK
jgi:hypothetical protein